MIDDQPCIVQEPHGGDREGQWHRSCTRPEAMIGRIFVCRPVSSCRGLSDNGCETGYRNCPKHEHASGVNLVPSSDPFLEIGSVGRRYRDAIYHQDRDRALGCPYKIHIQPNLVVEGFLQLPQQF